MSSESTVVMSSGGGAAACAAAAAGAALAVGLAAFEAADIGNLCERGQEMDEREGSSGIMVSLGVVGWGSAGARGAELSLGGTRWFWVGLPGGVEVRVLRCCWSLETVVFALTGW